ncbi:MAG: hypothetical protein WA277_06040 [Nitrospirota bacterium]
MTCILIGHKYKAHRLGTVYGTTTLDSVATGINACGTFTTSLPASPSTNQIITINNTCTGTITVSGNGNNIGAVSSVTLAAGVSGKFYWDGYTWGVWYHNNSITALSCAASVLNATHDFGTTTQGPAETAYTVPANTVEYSGWWVNACGETVRRVITTTYAGRSEVNQWKVSNYWINSPFFVPFFSSGLQYAYGATQTAAKDNVALKILTLCPVMMTHGDGLIFGPSYYNLGTFDQINGNNTVSPFQPAATFLRDSSIQNVFNQLTLYYLDTSIIWTYETL